MTDMSESLQTEEELRREDRATQERIERFAVAAAKIGGTEVTVSAPRGEVRVTVTTSGALRHIELSASGARLAAGDIVPIVQDCVQRAQVRIAEVAQEILAAEVGDDPSAELVLMDYQARFPAGEPEASAVRRTGEQGDETEQPVLRAAWSTKGGW